MNKCDRFWIKLMQLGRSTGCHQMVERSFSFRGYQFPVCARCTGVFAGELLGIGLLLAGIKIPLGTAIPLLGIMGLDWFVQKRNIRMSTNRRRFLTGICGGLNVVYFYYYLITL